jgi:hypothetical protein
MDRQAHEFPLIDDGPFDVLPDPPGGVGAEPEAAFVIELFDGLDKAQIAFFNDIGKGKPPMHIALPDTDDEAQVGFNHLLARLLVAGHDQLTEVLLLLKRQESRPADLPQITLKRIQALGPAGLFFRLIGNTRLFSVIRIIDGPPPRFTHRKTPAA